jgi:hypothetical protein
MTTSLRDFLMTVATAGAFTLCIQAQATAGPSYCSSDSPRIVQVGIQDDDPEKETVGLLCRGKDVDETASTSRAGPVRRSPVLPIGATTGDPEKDTFAFAQTVLER